MPDIHLRPLHHATQVCYPKPTDKPEYHRLVKQLEALDVPFTAADALTSASGRHLRDDYDILIDAMFGFSFKGSPRPPFAEILQVSIRKHTCKPIDALHTFWFMASHKCKQTLPVPLLQLLASSCPSSSPPAIVSVDIPSGWDVEGGDVSGSGLMPDMLVSLTAPKKAAQSFKGRHYLGGRFVPPKLAAKYNLKLPPFPGTAQFVKLSD
eukprot:jgi/Chrzof1/6579/Cz19g01220.t1